MEPFRPHSRSKAELAMAYFPDESPNAARQRLMRWIKRCHPLLKVLRELGYRSHQHYLTTAQVKKIVDFLGVPEERQERLKVKD